MQQEHGGNLRHLARQAGIPEDALLDFSANLNPLGPPEWYRALINASLHETQHYPDPEYLALREAAAERYGTGIEEILPGNGSSELIHLLPRLFLSSRAVIMAPAYSEYALACRAAGLMIKKVLLKEETGFKFQPGLLEPVLRTNDLVFIGQPNNPTGSLCDADALRALALRHPSVTFVMDEAFADFVEGMDSLTKRRPVNVLVMLSLTKFFAMPGLRLGCAIGEPAIIRRMKELLPPWSVNTLAQAIGVEALKDKSYAEHTRQYVRDQRETLTTELRAIDGLTVYTGEANFVLVRIDSGKVKAQQLAGELLKKGIAIRLCENFDGLDSRFFRVAVRTGDENSRLCDAVRTALGGVPQQKTKKKTPAIMFQGTSSNAGKSILTAALCRILLQDGYSVAPFKSQNMSLNSFVTDQGGEMGRAQVVQAQACRIAADVRMNPILLKPNSDTGSQVIVLGKPVGNMNVDAYIHYKTDIFATVKETYDSLAAEHDVIVLEGAGSPAEVNLKRHDIVNMRMARYAKSPVLLVGDIDRGGVFASFIGTMAVLAQWERSLIAGFVINRFRGKSSLLQDAIEYLERYTGRPSCGVVPYIHTLGLPEEDSVSFKNAPGGVLPGIDDKVEIALIDLPHISNFTDFDAFRIEPDVQLRVVRSLQETGSPDAVMIPGSKNVMADLEYLKNSGLAEKIRELAGAGKTEIIGICGGFQMLGKTIADPDGIESKTKSISGLGLLPVTTRLAREKILKLVQARHVSSGLTVKGYEIHHGQTDSGGLADRFIRQDGEVTGVQSAKGLVWGTYLHGVFDADEFRRWFIDGLRKRRGRKPIGSVQAVYDIDAALDRLAGVVRENIPVSAIYRMMGLR